MANTSPQGNTVTTGTNAMADVPVVKVYNPAVVGTPHAVLFNNGTSNAYIGGSGVTVNSGLLFPPGAQLSLPFANSAIWATGAITTGTPSTSLSVAGTAGGTALTFAGSVASFGTGTTVSIATGTAQEFVTLATITSGTVITLTAPLLYDHLASSTVTTITAQSATALSVNSGTT